MYLAPASFAQKIILTQDEFSKLTKTHKQKQAKPAVPPVTSTPEVNTRLSLSAVEVDLNKSRCNSANLQYNQVKTML